MLKVAVALFVIITIIDITNAFNVAQGAVRLYRNGVGDTSQSWSSGIVQIYYSSAWGNICDDFWFGSDEADVICRQLSYTGASSFSNTGDTFMYGMDGLITAMDRVTCQFSAPYYTITQCFFRVSGISPRCDNTDDAIVSCYSTRIWDSPSTGDIRLTGGTYSNQGLLEVYCNGQWGTVCNRFFFGSQARVACRQLGYNYHEDFDHLPQRGNSTQSIWLEAADSICSSLSADVSCLTSCGNCPSTAITDCTHTQDVTIECRYDETQGQVYSDTSTTCEFRDDYTNDTPLDDDDDNVDYGSIVGAIIGSIAICVLCVVITVVVPLCICLCLGIGIGSSRSTGPRRAAARGMVTQSGSHGTSTSGGSGYPVQQLAQVDAPPRYTAQPVFEASNNPPSYQQQQQVHEYTIGGGVQQQQLYTTQPQEPNQPAPAQPPQYNPNYQPPTQ